jgi:hypothetical protein
MISELYNMLQTFNSDGALQENFPYIEMFYSSVPTPDKKGHNTTGIWVEADGQRIALRSEIHPITQINEVRDKLSKQMMDDIFVYGIHTLIKNKKKHA